MVDPPDASVAGARARWRRLAKLVTFGAMALGGARPLAATPGPQPAAPAPAAPVSATPTSPGLPPAPAAPAPPTPAPAPAQSQPIVKGVIRDADGLPIPGAVVSVQSSANGAASSPVLTDLDGRFSLAAPPGATLLVEAEGYATSFSQVTDGAELELVLSPAGGGEVIEIVGRKPTSVAGAVSLDREQMATLPGTGGDLLASLDVLPGVTDPSGVGPGGGQGVIIRGSAPEDSRILLDGFDIPQLYHFLNRSILPTRAVAGLEYLPGGFDVRHGRASSGIVSITSRGGGDKVEGSAEVSVIDANVLASGPVGDKSHVMASFRRSYLDAYLSSILPDDIGLITAPRYYDGLLRIDTELSQRWRGAATVVGSSDLTELVASDDQTSEDTQFRADTKFIRGIAAATWRGSRGTMVDIASSVLAQEISFTFDDQFLRVDQLSIATRLELTRSIPSLAGLTNVVWRTGAEVDPRRYALNLSLDLRQDEGQPDDGMDIIQNADATFWRTDVGVWSALEASLSSTLRLSVGLRVDGFTRNDDYPVQPRGELTFTPNDLTKLRLSAGRYTRAPTNGDELLDRDLKAESATQIALGGEHKLGRNGSVQLTVYNTDRTDLITRDEMQVYRNQGTGRSYGLDALASYRTDRWFGWLSYSLSRSTRRDTATGRERLFDYDQTHDLVAALTYKSRNQRWQLGGKFTYTTGQPTTPVLGSIYNSDLDEHYPVNGDTNTERLPAHHQIDLRADYFWRFRTWTMSVFLDINNTYLNAKVEQYQYNYDYTEREQIEGLPIVPSIGLRGEL